MRGLRYGSGLLLAAVWVAPLQRAGTRRHHPRARHRRGLAAAAPGSNGAGSGARAPRPGPDGAYVLTGIPAGTDTLRVTMIGYAPVARPVTVSAGEALDARISAWRPRRPSWRSWWWWATASSGRATSPARVTNVTSQEFNKGRVVTPTELIQNKVAGVQVVENTEPGGRTSIRIRGGPPPTPATSRSTSSTASR